MSGVADCSYQVYEGQCPVPPSANNLHSNRRKGGGKGRVRSSEYTRWINAAGLVLGQKPEPLTPPVSIRLRVGKVRMARDIDNIIKPTVDLLKTMGWIADDNLNHVTEVSIVADFAYVPQATVVIEARGRGCVNPGKPA